MPAPPQIALRGERRCRICPQPPRPGRQLCTGCETSLDHALDPAWDGDPQRRIPASIPVYWARLDPTPGRGGDGQRRAPGFMSTPPCSLDALVLRDSRSKAHAVAPVWFTQLPNGRDAVWKPHREQDGQPRPVEVALHELARGLWLPDDDPDQAADAAAGGVGTVAAWLHQRLDRVISSDRVREHHRLLADLQHDLRTACGDQPDKPVGACTGWIPQPRGERAPCAAPIYPAPPGAEPDPKTNAVTSCERCSKPYGVMDLARMKRINQTGQAA